MAKGLYLLIIILLFLLKVLSLFITIDLDSFPVPAIFSLMSLGNILYYGGIGVVANVLVVTLSNTYWNASKF